MSWELQKGRNTFTIKEYCGSFRYKIHFVQLLTVRNDNFSWFEDSAVHVHDQFMLESYFSVNKEVAKLYFERIEKRIRNLIL